MTYRLPRDLLNAPRTDSEDYQALLDQTHAQALAAELRAQERARQQVATPATPVAIGSRFGERKAVTTPAQLDNAQRIADYYQRAAGNDSAPVIWRA